MKSWPVAGEVLGQRQQLLDVFLGQHVGAGGDLADERHVAGGPAVDGDPRVGVVANLDGAGLGRVPPQIPLTLQGGQVRVHGGR